jgi:RNA polymerase subunit RPABC4/transcription elongation factor Spt4
MQRKNMLLKPLAAWLIVAGIVTIISIIYAVFVAHTVDVIVGILLMIFLFLVSGWEITAARSVWGSQVGERDNIVRSMSVVLLARVLLIYLVLDLNTFGDIGRFQSLSSAQQTGLVLSILLIVSAVAEIAVLLVATKKKEYFQPSKEEMENALRKVGTTKVKSVSECPKCKELVETTWSLCPNCGSALPKFCANCGAELKAMQDTCPSCGAKVESSESLRATIQTLKASAESPAMQETRSARYARLAEAQLKGGDMNGAVESYKKAIQSTEFDRKRTNFMVKMAVILYNTGQKDEALKLLDQSLEMEPDDWAGARKVMDDIKADMATTKLDSASSKA